MNTIIIITIMSIITILIFSWIINLDIKSILILGTIIAIIIFSIAYFTIPEFSLKLRIVNETNYNQTLEDVKNKLNKEDYEYYRLAILMNSKEDIYKHTVNHIIKIGKDNSKIKINNYIK